MKKLGMLGFMTWVASGITLFVLQVYWFDQWWGLLGVLAALIFAPLSQIFPLLYWLKEGFPLTYLIVWLVGIAGLAVGIQTVKVSFRRMFKRNANFKKAVDREVIDIDPED